jgi:hypothetical protein
MQSRSRRTSLCNIEKPDRRHFFNSRFTSLPVNAIAIRLRTKSEVPENI